MTSSPPSVESADGLEAAVRKLRTQDFMMVANDGLDERRFHFVKLFDVLELIAADRKAREDHDRAERAELAKQLWAALRPQDGIPFYTISREKFDSIVSKLEADSQPKQEREA